ncbi:MAG: hypothetical protein JSR18_06170 [Proteobacteria bacterium]|nr:hypothetical protein [Pseudomonadota bacterium]
MLVAITLACQFALQLIPQVGTLLSLVLAPLVGCSLIVASDRIASGGVARLVDVTAGFRLSAGSMLAVIAGEAVEFIGHAAVAYGLSDVNLFVPGRDDGALTTTTLVCMFFVGTLVSLPVTFVPFFAVLDDAGLTGSLKPSVRAFFANLPALLVYGLLSFALLIAGLVVLGPGVLLILPLFVLAAYAGLRDVYPR